MRAEDHQPRKSDGKKPNCGHAARTRSLNTCERLLRSACGPERDVILVGWRLPVALDGSGETSLGLAPGGSGRGFTSGARFQTRIRIVDSCVDVFSDPGANPGASTNLRSACQAKVAHRSAQREGGLFLSAPSFGWQATLRSHLRRRVPTVAFAKVGCHYLPRASAGKPTFALISGGG